MVSFNNVLGTRKNSSAQINTKKTMLSHARRTNEKRKSKRKLGYKNKNLHPVWKRQGRILRTWRFMRILWNQPLLWNCRGLDFSIWDIVFLNKSDKF